MQIWPKRREAVAGSTATDPMVSSISPPLFNVRISWDCSTSLVLASHQFLSAASAEAIKNNWQLNGPYKSQWMAWKRGIQWGQENCHLTKSLALIRYHSTGLSVWVSLHLFFDFSTILCGLLVSLIWTYVSEVLGRLKSGRVEFEFVAWVFCFDAFRVRRAVIHWPGWERRLARPPQLHPVI